MMTNQSNIHAVIIAIVTTIAYLFVLGVLGLYGDTAMYWCRLIGLYILKYGGAALGLVLCMVLPVRISTALKHNEERAKRMIEQYRQQQAAEKAAADKAKLDLLAQLYSSENVNGDTTNDERRS